MTTRTPEQYRALMTYIQTEIDQLHADGKALMQECDLSRTNSEMDEIIRKLDVLKKRKDTLTGITNMTMEELRAKSSVTISGT